MKIGFASLIGVEPIPFPELVQWAGTNGLHALEVNVGPGFPKIDGAQYGGHLDLLSILRDGPQETRELLAANGVEISSLAPMINLLTADLAKREERIAFMKHTIDACVVLGVDTVVTFTGSAFGMHFWGQPGVGDGHTSNRVGENLRIFTEVYGPMADYAEDRGVRIAFETAGRGGPEGNLSHSPELWGCRRSRAERSSGSRFPSRRCRPTASRFCRTRRHRRSEPTCLSARTAKRGPFAW